MKPSFTLKIASLLAGSLLLSAEQTRAAGTMESGASARISSDKEAWWTGPIAASSADTLPRGRLLVEPYLFVMKKPGQDHAGSLAYLLFGVTDELTIGVIPTFDSYKSTSGNRSRQIAVGDATLAAQYRLHRANPGGPLPTISLVVHQVVPLGRFDRLGKKLDRGIGGGAATTSVGLYAQRLDRTASGRFLRTRLNLMRSFPKNVSVRGASVYGTPEGFGGKARVGGASSAVLSFEYSLSRKWVLATDFIFKRAAQTRVAGLVEEGDSIRRHEGVVRGASAFSVAPAVEYSWSATRGVLAGVRISPEGRNSPASITPVIAFNAIF